jgi:hypothetical protein
MTHLTHPSGLDDLGHALTRATEQDLRRTRRRPVRRIAIALAILAVVGTGTAAAAGLFSPKQVAAAMPAGGVIFDQTNPSCVKDASADVFHCTLASLPAPDAADFTGTKEILVVDGKVAGGCIGQDATGLSWDCYIGQDAVDMEIISQDFLDEPAGPGRG